MVSKRTSAGGAAIAATLLSLAAGCGAPELTYRQDVPDSAPDTPLDSDAGHDVVSADQGTDTDSAPDALADASVDSSAEAGDDASDAPLEVGEGGLDAASEAAADAALDQAVDSPADVAEDAPPTCPLGMADVPRPTTGVYCVDATEVRAAEYQAWLATSPLPSAQLAPCTGNAAFEPATSLQGCTSATFDPAGRPDHPVVCVDWCDAKAYCEAHGKRLCGGIGGGPAAFNKYKNPASDEWYRACSEAGFRSYPYGDTYLAGSCNGADYGAGATIAAASASACAGGYAGLHDMSGNVQEWENSCDGAAPDSACRLRGGGFTNVSASLQCASDRSDVRLTAASDVGFRCCRD